MSAKPTSTAIPCHITPSERDALNIVAVDLGYKNVSAFVRATIFDVYGDLISQAEADAETRRNAHKSRTLKQA